MRRRLGRGGRLLSAGGAGRPGAARLQDRARARDADGVAGAPRRGRASSRSNDQLDAALREYRKATEVRPEQPAGGREGRRSSSGRSATASRPPRPKPPIEQMREQARQASAEPMLNPASREPLSIRFTNASVRDILNFIGNATGINVTYDRDFQDRPVHASQLDGVTLEQALQPDPDREPAVLQGAERADDHRHPRDTPPSARSTKSRSSAPSTCRTPTPTEMAQLLTRIVRVAGDAGPAGRSWPTRRPTRSRVRATDGGRGRSSSR